MTKVSPGMTGHQLDHDRPTGTRRAPMTSSSIRLLAAASLIGAMTLTGANVAFGKAIVAEIPVYVFLLMRFVVAVAALALSYAASRGRSSPR